MGETSSGFFSRSTMMTLILSNEPRSIASAESLAQIDRNVFPSSRAARV